MQTQQLCLACSSTIAPNTKPAAIYVHGCCSRPICPVCLDQNPRLRTFCPICEDAQAAFRKGPRSDVTRVGEVVFDAAAALKDDQLQEEVPPPPYEAKGESTFVVDDEASDDEGAKAKSATRPSLLTRQSKGAASAEVDVAPHTADTVSSTTEDGDCSTGLTAFRRLVDPHSAPTSSAEASSSRPTTGETRQYYLRKTDTLQSIAIRFNVSSNELCLLNALPRAVLSTSPHLLHTRSFILIPSSAVEAQLSRDPQLLSSLAGPPQKSAQEKTTAARRTAEAKFRATLARGVGVGETQADEKAARAYVGLAEDEVRWVDFGEGYDGDGLPSSYDDDAAKGKDAKGTEDQEMREAQLDTARRHRFDAILQNALAKWEMDSDWERNQRANSLDPSSISKPLPASSSSQMDQEPKGSTLGKWFTRALHGESSRGKHPSSREPRHVVSLSSSVLLPTCLEQTLVAHKAPVNVARYNSTGRYILTGSSDRTIKLWNAHSEGDAIQTYAEHNQEVLALDVSQDNARFVSGGGDKSVLVWDVGSGSVVRRFSGFMGKINDVRFGGRDGDGSVVVTGGFDGVVRVFDLRAQGAWRPIMELKEAKDAVTSISVRQDKIYTGAVDGVLRCYDLRAGQLRADTLPAPITSVAPSRLGSSVLVATLDSTVRLLDQKDGTLLHAYKGHTHDEYRCKAVFANEEDGIVIGDEEGRLVGWDVVTGENVAVGDAASGGKVRGKAVLWVECNPHDSQQMVSAGADGTVKIWSTPPSA
ncbi:WD40 repeat [Kalmanozyma brasiliensis GHG001]|uniref:Uncharacterized protein n=1 Tax=Kalmanozyma brasiliensis (strain GHG001) TaxID=1365824 RepID=V5EAM8_KALBG|nr:WD40 repeat [Kalmanozyma brasiliensis GHG001]EST07456.1 WD40 repeat [Kalmanozyma brasiliensis GHG001]